MRDKTIDQKEVQAQLSILENRFSVLFSLKSEMLTHEEGIFTALYLNSIGYKQYQKYRLSIDISILKYRINLITSYIDRFEKPDFEYIEQQINERFAEYQKKIDEEKQRIVDADIYLKSGNFSYEEVKKIKSIYQQIVKKLHPDLHPFQTKVEKTLFIRTQQAYNTSDLSGLKMILQQLKKYDFSVHNSKHFNSKNFIDELEQNVDKLRIQVEELENQFPFNYRHKLADDEWIETEQKALEEEISSLLVQKNKMSRYLLLLHVWKPESLN